MHNIYQLITLAMIPTTLIFAILMAYIPDAQGSPPACGRGKEICKGNTNRRWIGPNQAMCGELLGDGTTCKERRSKTYYVCTTCQYILVKNKRMEPATQEGCTHENRYVLRPGETPPFDSGGTSKATPSTNCGEIIYYDFFSKK
jgi:hypothetical protein